MCQGLLLITVALGRQKIHHEIVSLSEHEFPWYGNKFVPSYHPN